MDGKTVLSNKDLFSNSSGVVSERGIFSDLVTKKHKLGLLEGRGTTTRGLGI